MSSNNAIQEFAPLKRPASPVVESDSKRRNDAAERLTTLFGRTVNCGVVPGIYDGEMERSVVAAFLDENPDLADDCVTKNQFTKQRRIEDLIDRILAEKVTLPEAARLGAIRKVNGLLENGNPSKEDLEKASVMAATNGHVDVVIALEKARKISDEADEVLEKVLKAAAENGHLKFFEEFLSGRDISIEARGDAAHAATLAAVYADPRNKGQKRPNLSPADPEKCDPVRAKALHILNLLFANGPISDDDLHSSLRCAAHNGDREVLNALLAKQNPSDETYGRTVVDAAQANELDTVTELLDKRAVSPEHRGKAVVWTVKKRFLFEDSQANQVLVVKALLEKGPITDAHLEEAVGYVCSCTCMEAVKLFFTHNSTSEFISKKACGYAVVRASKAADHDFLEELLKRNIPEQYYMPSIIEAAEEGLFKTVYSCFCANPNISEESRKKVYEKALEKARIVNDFFEKEPNDANLEKVVGYTLRHNCMELVKLLLLDEATSKFVSDKTRGWASCSGF